jgi:hypothetical protein
MTGFDYLVANSTLNPKFFEFGVVLYQESEIRVRGSQGSGISVLIYYAVNILLPLPRPNNSSNRCSTLPDISFIII